jgi:hypothetical protein
VNVLIVALTFVLIAVVVAIVGAPLRRARGAREVGIASGETAPDRQGPARASQDTHDQLDAAREAKYREIRDAELDFRTGKLSREDYEAIDGELRAEAIEILNRLERLKPTDA